MYELRLGVDHNAGNHLPVKPTPTPETPTVCKQNGMLENGDYDHQHNHHHHHPSETGSTADSVATSSSDCPTGTVSSAGEVTSMSEAGSVCGRVEWRRMRLPKESETSDEYTRWPKLRFRILWRALSHTPNNISPRKLPRTTSLTRASATPNENGKPRRSAVKSPCKPDPFSEIVPNTPDTPRSKATTRPRKPSTRPYLLDRAVLPDRPVTYGFFYLGRLQQWSESNDFRCPWCRLDCWRARERAPEALFIHLRTCHPRFRFKASWSSSRSHLTLEVSLNEAYDGSNDCGLRRWSYELTNNLNGRWSVPRGQLIGGWTGLGLFGGGEQSNKSLSLAGSSARVPCPVRRLPYTHLIFWRGAERVNDQPFDPTLSVRPIATGHNRVYYHTRTMQPIRACEFDVDSEAEDSPVWLWQHYQRKLEEFTDVNQGEKQIMQLWNSLLLSLGPSELITYLPPALADQHDTSVAVVVALAMIMATVNTIVVDVVDRSWGAADPRVLVVFVAAVLDTKDVVALAILTVEDAMRWTMTEGMVMKRTRNECCTQLLNGRAHLNDGELAVLP
ncbi:unnamed protein product [Dicrocoelium dendriticum]|nr:unnamed protein product [Dicrocoelium dendriticum]